MGEPAYDASETAADQATSLPKTLIIVSPRDNHRVKVERAYSALGLPAPYVARSTDEGREQAIVGLYDIIIADVVMSADRELGGLTRLPDRARKAFIGVDATSGRSFLDVNAHDFGPQLAEAVYSHYRRMLVMEAERGDAYQEALKGSGEVLVRRDEAGALATLRQGGIDLLVIGHGVDYTKGKSLSYGLRTVEAAHKVHPEVPILLETMLLETRQLEPDYDSKALGLLRGKATQKGAYGVVTRTDDLTELAAKAREALKGKKPQSLMAPQEKAKTTKPLSSGAERKYAPPSSRGMSDDARAALRKLLMSAGGRARLDLFRAKHGSPAPEEVNQ
jgi:hypothetical protein